MSDEMKLIKTLAADFMSVARHRQAQPHEAVAALMATASAVLVVDFGEEQAAALLHSMIDEAMAEWQAGQCAGRC